MKKIQRGLPLLVFINDYWNNKINYKDDDYNHWQTPMETLKLGTGNCKDYAIAKYYNLIDLGVDEEKLKLAYVKITIEGKIIPHLVVFFQNTNNEIMVLDNVAEVILPLSKRSDLDVIFVFDQKNIYNPDLSIKRNGITTIKSWSDVVDKMKKSSGS